MELKKYYNKAKISIKIAFVFWIVETIVFLFIHGWHYYPIGIEKYFDTIATLIMFYSAWNYVFAINIIVKGVLKNLEVN